MSPTAMAECIVRNRGNFEDIAAEMGCSVRAIYNYRDRYPVVAEALDETRKRVHDHVRRRLLDLIDDGNVAATIFWLKTQGKEEGWTERTELSGPGGRPLTLEHRGGIQVHGSVEHVAQVFATLAAVGAVPLPFDGFGSSSEDDLVYLGDSNAEATSLSVADM